jgi:hypothetical protein
MKIVVILFLAVLGFELTLSRQAIYHFSHSVSPLLCWVCSIKSLENYLPGLALKRDPSDLCLPSSYDYSKTPNFNPDWKVEILNPIFFLLLCMVTNGYLPLIISIPLPGEAQSEGFCFWYCQSLKWIKSWINLSSSDFRWSEK